MNLRIEKTASGRYEVKADNRPLIYGRYPTLERAERRVRQILTSRRK